MKIYYWNNIRMMLFFSYNDFRDGTTIHLPEVLKQDYTEMPINFSGKETNMEDVFSILNSEENPLSTPENQEFIRKNKLHTSMSVGDIIKSGEDWRVVMPVGFARIQWIPERKEEK